MHQQDTDEMVTDSSLLKQLAASTDKPYALQLPTAFPKRARDIHIGFLFNHEQGHQLAHSAPILAALATKDSGRVHLHAFVSCHVRRQELKAFIPKTLWHRITVHHIPPPAPAGWVEKATGGAVPMRRIGALFKHRALLGKMTILVAPETTCIMLKTHMGCRNTRFIYTQHGAGDRAVGFKKIIREFDHVLVPGLKIRDRMLDKNIIREGNFSLVGYPKFDAVARQTTRRLFPNERQVVIYNPHFHPALSSWYKHGLRVLEFFAENSQFNLIFAPHVMLFSRKIHMSLSPLRLQQSGAIPARFFNCPNIIIDQGSACSTNMTYTRAADIYLGDVSSQVYETITTPKPCIFLRNGHEEWFDDPNFAHWHLGKVVDDIDRLGSALANQSWFDDILRARQEAAFGATFGSAPFGAAERAANAIIKISGAEFPATSVFPPSRFNANDTPARRGEFHA